MRLKAATSCKVMLARETNAVKLCVLSATPIVAVFMRVQDSLHIWKLGYRSSVWFGWDLVNRLNSHRVSAYLDRGRLMC
jgi:hypothetical protein